MDDDRDIAEIHRRVDAGELFSFNHEAETVRELEGRFIEKYLHLNNIPPEHGLSAERMLEVDHLTSVETRTYELCTNKRIPPYMVKRYTRRMPPRPPLLPTQRV